MGETTTNAAESQNAAKVINSARRFNVIDAMITMHDEQDKKLNVLHGEAMKWLLEIDENGQPSPMLVCETIQRKLEHQIASLFFDYRTQLALQKISEITNIIIRNGESAITNDVNSQLTSIDCKFEIWNVPTVPPSGDYVKCTLVPTARYQQMCQDKDWGAPSSFTVKIQPFDEVTESINCYTEHTCTCGETFTYGYVCKHIGLVLYFIRKIIHSSNLSANGKANFPWKKYLWTRKCFYDVNYHSETLKRQCDIDPIPLMNKLTEWSSLSPMPLLPSELHKRNTPRNASRLTAGATKRKVDSEEGEDLINNSNLVAGLFERKNVVNEEK